MTQMASRLVQPFLHRWPQSVPVLYNGTPLSPLKTAPSHEGIWTPIPTRILNPNGISISSAVFPGLTSVTDRQTNCPTDHATQLVTTGRIYDAMRPNNKAVCWLLTKNVFTCFYYGLLLWPPYVIGGPLYFCPVVSFFLSIYLLSFFPRLISAAADWMSTILLHMAWP